MQNPSQPPSPGPIGSLGSPQTYTYTDAELTSLLTCVLDEGQAGNPGALPLPLGGSGPAPGHSLQFLPHLPLPSSMASSDTEPSMFVPTNFTEMQPMIDESGSLQVPLNLSLLRVQPQSQPGQVTGGGLVDLESCGGNASNGSGLLGQVPTAQQQQQTHHYTRQSQRSQPPRITSAARAASLPSPSTNAKQPHNLVEKQRRDRINHLIDELRELVPPHAPGGELGSVVCVESAGSNGDSRRPKHVVLSDTIRLIKDLQMQVAEMQLSPGSDSARGWQQYASQEALNNSAQQPWQQSCSLQDTHQQQLLPGLGSEEQPQQHQQQQASGARRSIDGMRPELPHAPDDAASCESAVLVESENGQIRYVKVTCPDRHGLLADVVRALRELPLEITTAAITTRRDHVVYDVFEVEVQDPNLSVEQLQQAVEAAALWLPTEKKRKQESHESPCSGLMHG